MPTSPLQRLMFAQGGDCFFCRKPLNKAEASVEHLVALANGGSNSDENCVACCKALNSLLGRMSLKEKLQVVINQRGHFVCPAAMAVVTPGAAVAPTAPVKPANKAARTHAQRFALVVADLQKRGNARPGTVDKLLNTIKSQMASLGEPGSVADTLLGELRSQRYIDILADKVVYSLPGKGDALPPGAESQVDDRPPAA